MRKQQGRPAVNTLGSVDFSLHLLLVFQGQSWFKASKSLRFPNKDSLLLLARWKFPICFIELPPQEINRSASCDYIYYVFIVYFLYSSNVITAQRPDSVCGQLTVPSKIPCVVFASHMLRSNTFYKKTTLPSVTYLTLSLKTPWLNSCFSLWER